MNLQLLNIFNIHPSTILDIGANVGNFAKLCKFTWPDCWVFCVEPNEHCEHFLKNCCDKYEISLLSDEIKTIDYFFDNNNECGEGNSIYKELVYSDYTSTLKKTTTLNQMFEKTYTFDLIKMDTQGSELDIIKGGIELISRCKCLIVEISLLPYNKNAANPKDVINFMLDLNFHPILKLENHIVRNKLLQIDLAFIPNSNL